MLKLKYLDEDFSLAKAALAYYEHDEDRLDEALSWYRISSNAIYPFFRQKELYLLRMAPKEEKDYYNIAGELHFIDYLKQNRFSCLEAIPNKDGNVLFEMNNYYISAFKKVNGVALDDIDLTEEIAYIYGQSLGEMHKISKSMPKISGKWDEERTFQFMEESFKQNHAPESILERFEDLKKAIRLIPHTENNYGLIHYDYEPDNVFYNQKTQKISVIDFDDSIYFFYYFDVLRALDSLEDEKLCDAFLKGYQDIRKLSQQEQVFNNDIEELMYEFWDLNTYARVSRAISDIGAQNKWKNQLVNRMKKRIKEIESGE